MRIQKIVCVAVFIAFIIGCKKNNSHQAISNEELAYDSNCRSEDDAVFILTSSDVLSDYEGEYVQVSGTIRASKSSSFLWMNSEDGIELASSFLDYDGQFLTLEGKVVSHFHNSIQEEQNIDTMIQDVQRFRDEEMFYLVDLRIVSDIEAPEAPQS